MEKVPFVEEKSEDSLSQRRTIHGYLKTMFTNYCLMKLLLLIFPYLSYAQIITVPLDNGWVAENANGSIRIPVAVPGGIYTDLQKAGVIGDPYYRFNDVETRWVAYDNWTYSKTFEVTPDILSKKNVWLQFDGLDTVSTVLVNDILVGKSDNMFVRYMFNIKSAVHNGNNTVKIIFESPVTYALHESQKHVSEQGYNIPPECSGSAQHGECHMNFIRKTQCSFSWDWGPAFPSVGIWKPARLVSFDSAIVQDILVTAHKGNDIGPWVLNVTVVAFVGGTESVQGTFLVQLGSIQKQFPAVFTPNPEGYALQEFVMDTENMAVELWWPNGYGEQTLYDLNGTFTSSDAAESSTKNIKFGFRTIELVQNTIPGKTGLTFFFKVNDVPIFMKGSNWIPADSFPERITYEYTRNLLQSTKDANMNMLRVWGGGQYESDNFYNIADELGILIWQDMIFASALYPVTDSFLASVSTEISQQIQRLQHHASAAVWAGNNENEASLKWFSPKPIYEDDYRKLYVDTIKSIIQKFDSSRAYLSSSQSNGDETIAENYVAKNPNDNRYGDVHFYDSADLWDDSTFPRPRFCSEYGVQSWPSFDSLTNVSIAEDWNYYSNFSGHRQHQGTGNDNILGKVQRHLPLPKGCPGKGNCTSVAQFKGLIYLSQVYQAVGIQTETEHYRRGRTEFVGDEGNTMGGLYWQLEDIWQAPTWASLEFGGKWKMLHYYAKNFFAPALASHFVKNGNLTVYGVSDFLQDVKNVTLNVDIYKWSSLGSAYNQQLRFDLLPSQASQIYQSSISSLFQSAGVLPAEGFIQVYLQSSDGSQLSPRNTIFPVNLINVTGLVMPTISISNVAVVDHVPGAVSTFQFTITTDSVAAFLWLEASGIKGRFSDNGFHLVQPETVIQFYSWEFTTTDALAASIKTFSLADISSI